MIKDIDPTKKGGRGGQGGWGGGVGNTVSAKVVLVNGDFSSSGIIYTVD